MAWPGYPDSFDPGWWRVNVVTPPSYTGVGTLDGTTAAVTAWSATNQGQPIVPVAGQQVAGVGVPQLAVVAASPAPTATTFTMSLPSTAAGTVQLTMGSEPVTLAEAIQWARVEVPDDNSLIQDIIA